MERILIIGGTSKLASKFIGSQSSNVDITATYNESKPMGVKVKEWVKLNLCNKNEIDDLVQLAGHKKFNIVLFFSSTYNADDNDVNAYINQLRDDIQINALSFADLMLRLKIVEGGHIISFSDANMSPLPYNHTSYALSKKTLEGVSSIVAMRLPHVHVNQISLGSIIPSHNKAEPELKRYYDKHITRADDVPGGLVQLINDIIRNKHLSMTGSVITYDGGAHLFGERE